MKKNADNRWGFFLHPQNNEERDRRFPNNRDKDFPNRAAETLPPQFYLGLDAGSTTVKAVLLDANGELSAAPVCLRSAGRPLEALAEAIGCLTGSLSAGIALGVTGSGREMVREAVGLSKDDLLTEIRAHALGAWRIRPGVRTVIDIGGQDNKVIRLAPFNDGGFSIRDFVMNDMCAAGTGAFLEMHAGDLGFASVEEFGRQAATAVRAVKIAGRCAVLAHSDVIHLRQTGEKAEEIAAGLCRAAVLNVLAMAGGRKLESPVLFQGGVAANAGVVRALREALGTEVDLTVPQQHQTLGALGAALHARNPNIAQRRFSAQALLASLKQAAASVAKTPTLLLAPLPKPQPKENVVKNASVGSKALHAAEKVAEAVVGLDVGSASIKIAVLDLSGSELFTDYRLHEGRPFDALATGLKSARAALGEIQMRGTAVTGSGRDLVAARFGADLNVDEITAQGVGATRLAAAADSVFEIGGQDSKFIRLRDGRAEDFEMNRICAAGTGAFLMETARRLGVRPGAELSEAAFRSQQPVVVSRRCCVFAESDVVSRLNSGTPHEDVAAGVVYAVAKNYLTLVVGERDVGRKVLFLGGVAAACPAVAAAFRAMRPELDLVVPDQCELSGALGAAELIRRDVIAGKVSVSRFRGFASTQTLAPKKEFTCSGCANLCRVAQWQPTGETACFTGGVCGRYECAADGKKPGRNFAAEYLALLDSFTKNDGPGNPLGEPLGVPTGLLWYEQGPLWIAFLRALGFNPVLSSGGPECAKRGARHLSNPTVCLPMKVLLGHAAELVEKGVRKIFFPSVVEFQRRPGATRSHECMLIQAAADAFLKPAFPNVEFVSPVFTLEKNRETWRTALLEAGKQLTGDDHKARQAVAAAAKTWEQFQRAKFDLGREFLAKAQREAPAAVCFGRPYTFAPELDGGVPRLLAAQGLAVAPLIVLPTLETQHLEYRHADLVLKASQDAVLGAKFVMNKSDNLHPVLMTQFLCRQDSMVFPLLTHIVGTRAHLHLALDENVGLAGFKTRCAAFRRLLDEKSAVPQSPRASRPDGFQAPRYPKKTRGVVWVSLHVGAFYGAAFESIGWKTRFLPEDHPEVMERGQKYFSKGEPCLPFVQLAGALELMTQDPTFDPQNDVLHVPGTRHCASATLPHLCRNVLTQLGHPNLPIVSPREGMDMAEGVETFGIKFTRNLLRAMVAGEYLKKLRTSIRPYEIRTGETDRVYEACRKELYESFAKNRSFFGTVKKMIAVMTAIPTKNKGSRPQVLITGEYVVRTNPVLNLEIHRKIEALGGEAIYTPIFTDYAEMAARSRAANFWRLGMKFKALREKLFCTFSVHDCIRLKKLFAPHLPGQIEPNPLIGMADCAKEINSAADPMLRLELAQAGWPMKHGNIAGIINVSPFGCSVSTSVEPLLHKLFGDRVPVLGLAFDGQAGVHSDNRLAAFMECVRGRKSELPATSVKEQGMVVAALHQGA